MFKDKSLIKIKGMGLGKYGIDKIDYLLKNEIKYIEYIAIGEENKDLEAIKKDLKDLDVLFIISEINKGIEEHLLFKVCKMAKDMGILTIALFSTNFDLKKHSKIEKLKKNIDALIISDDKFLDRSFKDTNIFFKTSIRGIADLMTSSRLIGLDYTDIKKILLNSGIITIGVGEAEGENRTLEATQQALKNLSLQKSLNNFEKILLNITTSEDLGLGEVFAIADLVRKKTVENIENLLFSVVKLDDFGEGLNITIIATEKKEI